MSQKKTGSAATPEPTPQKNTHPVILDLVEMDLATLYGAEGSRFPYRVSHDLRARAHVGLAKYGTRLQPHNGRNAIMDLYQEVLDGVMYARQAVYEEQQAAAADRDSAVGHLAQIDHTPRCASAYRKLLDLATDLAKLLDDKSGTGEKSLTFRLRDVKFDAEALT